MQKQPKFKAIQSATNEVGFGGSRTLLVQREVAWRDDRRITLWLKASKLKVADACNEKN